MTIKEIIVGTLEVLLVLGVAYIVTFTFWGLTFLI